MIDLIYLLYKVQYYVLQPVRSNKNMESFGVCPWHHGVPMLFETYRLTAQ